MQIEFCVRFNLKFEITGLKKSVAKFCKEFNAARQMGLKVVD